MQAHKDFIKSKLHENLPQLQEGLAGRLKDGYAEQIETFNKEIFQVLSKGFELSDEEIYNLLNESEKESYQFTVGEIKIIFRASTNTNLVRKFNDDFKKDEKGQRREWKDIQEE